MRANLIQILADGQPAGTFPRTVTKPPKRDVSVALKGLMSRCVQRLPKPGYMAKEDSCCVFR